MTKIAGYGSIVCHYTTSAAAFEHILAERKLRFSPYRLMRDPMESKEWIFGAALFPDNFDGHGDEGSVYGQAHRAVNRIKSETKLLALTTDSSDHDGGNGQVEMFGRAWARAQMWELYAENHRGVCLVFDREGLHRALNDSLGEAGAGALYHGPVRYTPTGLAGAHVSFHLDNFKTKTVPEAAADFLEAHHRDLFLLKTLDWNSEHEYRYLAMSPGDDYLYGDFGSSLMAVVVGESCPPWQWPGVLDLCEQIDATAYRLHWLHEGPWPVELSKDLEKLRG